MDVAYFEIDLLPGRRHFNCSAQRTTLSVESCAAQYRRHKGGCSACTNCEIGAAHAGERVTLRPSVSACCRCGNWASRLVTDGLCVSCYNRSREVAKNRNGKGVPPRPANLFFGGTTPGKVLVLREVSIDAAVDGRMRVIRTKAATTLEGFLRAIRKCPATPVFSRAPIAVHGSWQLSLF